MRRLYAVVITVLVLCSWISAGEREHGSLVLVEVSPTEDFIVAAGDSKTLDEMDKIEPIQACKLMPLPEDSLFFVTGTLSMKLTSGKEWNAKGLAREISAAHHGSSNSDKAEMWGDETLKWWQEVPRRELEKAVSRDGSITHAGFAQFEQGHAIVIVQVLRYNNEASRVELHSIRLQPGNTYASGVATSLINEFLENTTDRAKSAHHGLDAQSTSQSEPEQQGRTLEAAIRFVIANGTADDVRRIGEPIDIVVVPRSDPIRWIQVKNLCNVRPQNVDQPPVTKQVTR